MHKVIIGVKKESWKLKAVDDICLCLHAKLVDNTYRIIMIIKANDE